MKDCDRYPQIEPDYQACAEELERREERRRRALDNAWEACREQSIERTPPFDPVEPKPPAAERIQPEPGFSQSA